jgi:hypothetical protein
VLRPGSTADAGRSDSAGVIEGFAIKAATFNSGRVSFSPGLRRLNWELGQMPVYLDLRLYICGEWRSRDGAPVINPADESILGMVRHATQSDLDDALAVAEKGLQVWRNGPRGSAQARRRIARRRA